MTPKLHNLENHEGKVSKIFLENARDLCLKIRVDLGRLGSDILNWTGYWDGDILLSAQSWQIIHEALLLEREAHRKRVVRNRLKAWQQRVGNSFTTRCKWIKGYADRTSNFLRNEQGEVRANIPDMFDLLDKAWIGPIFCVLKSLPEVTWEAFREEYREEILQMEPVAIDAIETSEFTAAPARRPTAKAGSLDGWRTAVLKALPEYAHGLFAGSLDTFERCSQWPKGLTFTPQSLLKKGLGEKPLDQRLLTLMSVIYSLWTSMRFHNPVVCNWRVGWLPPGSVTPGGDGIATTDVTIGTSLRSEVAKMNEEDVLILL